MLAGVAVTAHESLRGDHLELFTSRRLQPDGGGPCGDDGDCNNNGKCNGVTLIPPKQGTCRCKDGWMGLQCETQACGDVVSCGKHGKCHHDECKCDDGWKGDKCDDEIEYEVKLVVATIDSKTRRNSGCTADLNSFFDDLDGKNNDAKLKLDSVTIVPVPTKCGDGKSLQDRSIMDDRRRRHLKGKKDDDKEAILIGVILVNSSTRSVSKDACLADLKNEANRIQDQLKTKQLEDLDGTVVYIEADDECDTERLSKPNKD